jgi:mono/diheme cytochrome c family protein
MILNKLARVLALGLAFSTQARAAADAETSRQLVEFARSLNATVDIAHDVKSVLEPDRLKKACERHFARLDANDKLPAASQRNAEHVGDMLRCGKWMFFSANFESKMAIPENMIKAIPELFPEEAGPAFSRTGLIENPYDRGFPVGFVRLEKSPWGLLSPATGPARGITCATCHFGKLPDGRYAAGMPNQELDFGKVNALIVYSAWRADKNQKDPKAWPKDLRNFYAQLDKKLKKSLSPSRTLFDVAKVVSWLHATDLFYNLTGASRPIYEEAATWLSGTPNQYYASSPLLPIPGKSYWMSAPGAWDMKNYPGDFDAGLARPLSNFSPVKSAEDFVALAYIFQTGLDRYASARYVDPLVLYFRSLKTPVNMNPPPASLVDAGRQLFTDRCQSCHNGPDGETLQAHDAKITRTPEVLVDPLLNYAPPKKLSQNIYDQTVAMLGYEPLTNHGIYSRKLKGLHLRRHIMVNGSVRDLDHAFCLTEERGTTRPAFDGLRDDVHLDLCTEHEPEEKLALKAFLEDWL